MVSFIYSLTSDADKRLICCLDLKNITWAENDSFVSSEDISDKQSDLQIGRGIIPVFGEDSCNVKDQSRLSAIKNMLAPTNLLTPTLILSKIGA